MALAIKPKQRHTIQQYLAWERKADQKSEYYAGEIVLMAGGSPNHNRIAGNTYAEFNFGLRGSTCEGFNSDQRVFVQQHELYTYPDASVVCGPIDYDPNDGDAIANPVVLVEVLSPSTKNYDQGGKFELYRSIDTFRDYVVVHQDQVFIEYWHKGDDGHWVLTEIRDIEASLTLRAIDFTVTVRRIYERVDWLHDASA